MKYKVNSRIVKAEIKRAHPPDPTASSNTRTTIEDLPENTKKTHAKNHGIQDDADFPATAQKCSNCNTKAAILLDASIT